MEPEKQKLGESVESMKIKVSKNLNNHLIVYWISLNFKGEKLDQPLRILNPDAANDTEGN